MKQIGKKYVLSTKNSIWLLLLLFFTSCQYFRQDVRKTPIAQAYSNMLFFEDVNPKIYKNKSTEDSLQSIRDYIEKWAYKTLLVVQAKQNLDTVAINKLVNRYKQDLLIDTYKDLLAEKYLDTVVTENEIKQSYDKSGQYFLARNPLISSLYLVFDKNAKQRNNYKKWFFSNKPAYKDSLINYSIHFKYFNINEMDWQLVSDFKRRFPVFNRIKEGQILKKSKKFVLTDSLSLYLVLVKDFVKEKQPLPLGFIKNDLKQLILNQRKQKIIEKLQNEIKTEAIKQKKFKIFKIKKKDE